MDSQRERKRKNEPLLVITSFHNWTFSSFSRADEQLLIYILLMMMLSGLWAIKTARQSSEKKKKNPVRFFRSFSFLFFYFSPKSQKYQIQTRLLSFSLQALDIHKKKV
jgi:hypothetical protein